MSTYDNLNEMQREAVLHTEGPLLILAGAGSGKTRVLTHRVAYLIEEKGVKPWNILAITFTNKAAGEMRERVDNLAGPEAGSVWVSTFHSLCVRILRRFIDRLGYENNFTIYDTDDQKSLMKDICKKLNIDTKMLKERTILAAISSAKNELISVEAFEKQNFGDFNRRRIAAAYTEYQEQLKRNNALDFDDLLMKTVELFQSCEDVLAYYQDRFRYIMVDEYQDTNTAQFRLISLLAAKYRNLCVVGDDDQSIYKFRGANIRNILDFETVFDDAKVIRLEQNYRSTKHILEAANNVIKNNVGRKEKTLWTENEEGSLIKAKQFPSAFDEAEFVAENIAGQVRRGEAQYGDFAVLYRTNAQSRLFEEKFLMANIPYKIVGGVNFYARKEIKDLLCYLKTVDNARDDLAVRRIINVPRRGIGAATLTKVQSYAMDHEISFYQALEQAAEIPGLGRSVSKLQDFVTFIRTLRSQAEFLGVNELLGQIIESTGYVKELEAEDTDEARARIENIDELISKVVTYEESTGEPSLSGFLEEVALVADIDSLDENESRVVLMTLHSAKGLEFPNVYLTGMEEGLFPSHVGFDEDPDALEEERR
ncbi:UvrD/REP helicase, partial [Marvinbryantia formatexigens DSM 14469]